MTNEQLGLGLLNEGYQRLEGLHPADLTPHVAPPEYLSLGWRARKGPQESNTSGFRAIGHRVLLSPDIVEEVTASGIVLATKTVNAEKNMAVMCTVLEIGHDCWSDKSTDYCEVGDRVLVGMYTGKFHKSPIDGKEYRFVMDTDVISPLPKA